MEEPPHSLLPCCDLGPGGVGGVSGWPAAPDLPLMYAMTHVRIMYLQSSGTDVWNGSYQVGGHDGFHARFAGKRFDGCGERLLGYVCAARLSWQRAAGPQHGCMQAQRPIHYVCASQVELTRRGRR